MKKRVFSILICLTMLLTQLTTAALAAATDVNDTGTGARSATLTNTDTSSSGKSSVFLGNDKMELGPSARPPYRLRSTRQRGSPRPPCRGENSRQ